MILALLTNYSRIEAAVATAARLSSSKVKSSHSKLYIII